MDEKTRPSLHNVAVGEQVRVPMPSLAIDPEELLRIIRADFQGRVYASLDDEQVERIAVRVVALLAEKLTNAG